MSERLDSGRRQWRISVLVLLLAFPGVVAAQDNNGATNPPDPSSPPQVTATSPLPAGLFSEPKPIENGMQFVIDKFGDNRQAKEKNGLYLETSNMITGSGWVAAGPGYRKYFFDKEAFVDTSAAVSWHLYTMAQGRFEVPDLHDHYSFGAQVMWQDQTQIKYFGIGPDSLQADESMYQLRSFDNVAWIAARPKDSLTFAAELGWLHRPDVLAPGGTFKPNLPDTTTEFPNDPAVSLPFQPNFLHSELSAMWDSRNHRGHPTRGGIYRAAVTSYFDQSSSLFSFRQYEAEAAHFIPIHDDGNWILALRGWTVLSDVPTGHEIPFYFLPSVGGQNTIRSYPSFRFHDNDLVCANVESRWAIFKHVDAAVFFDAGNVAPDFNSLNFDKTGIGAGLRLHTDSTTFARVDVAHGAEGWHFVFRTTDPLRLARSTRRIVVIPFFP